MDNSLVPAAVVQAEYFDLDALNYYMVTTAKSVARLRSQPNRQACAALPWEPTPAEIWPEDRRAVLYCSNEAYRAHLDTCWHCRVAWDRRNPWRELAATFIDLLYGRSSARRVVGDKLPVPPNDDPNDPDAAAAVYLRRVLRARRISSQ